MSLFGCKDDSLLWFIILFILLFCSGWGKDNCCCEKDCNNDCGCGCGYGCCK